MRRKLLPLLLAGCFCLVASAKDSDADLVMFWPNQENAILKLTFSKFQNMGSYGTQMTLVSNVLVQNVSEKLIPKASFTVTLLDKDRVRIGKGDLFLDDLSPGESAKVQFQCASAGVPQ